MSTNDSPMLAALRREPHERRPVWFMRQAGRYLPGYMKVRSKTDFLTLCKTPDLAAEVTVEPLDKFGVDAVIIFSDILVPLEAMGLEVVFGDRGPSMEKPLASRADIDNLSIPDPVAETGFVMDVIREVKNRVAGRVPVIGFAGAPWTLACYALEGSPSRTFATAKRMVYEAPADLHVLMEKIADTTTAYLQAQVDAGAQVLQLFDSWGGMLAHGAFHELSLKYCHRILDGLKDCGVPRILFIKGAGLHLESIKEVVEATGTEAVAIDDSTPPSRAIEVLGDTCAIQGNLPPEALFAPVEDLQARTTEILESFRGHPGHVFNLGHGITPPTPIPHVQAVVDAVKAWRC